MDSNLDITFFATTSGEKAFVAGADISEFADFNIKEGGRLAAKGQELLFDFF